MTATASPSLVERLRQLHSRLYRDPISGDWSLQGKETDFNCILDAVCDLEALTAAPAPEDAELVKLRDWCQSKADACMEGKRPTIARRHYAQAYLTVAEKINIMLPAPPTPVRGQP